MSDFNSLPPAERPADALAAVVALRVVADKLEKKAVRAALEQGWTWAQIAEALGVTRQAAHKKHSKHMPDKRRS